MNGAHAEEYRTVMENYAQLAIRRQNLNSLFVGLNAFFLTGLGFLLSKALFNSWLLVYELGAIAAVILPMNVTWLIALTRYIFQINIHFDYLKSIERDSAPASSSQSAAASPGVLSAMDARAGEKHYGTSQLERGLAIYFVILYPLITVLVAGLTYAISVLHLLGPIQ